MTGEMLLFILRLGAAMTLFLFIGAVGVMLWRDYRQTETLMTSRIRPRGRLVLVDSGDSSRYAVGQIFPILTRTTLGRAPTNTIQLNEPFVSNDHARLEWHDGQWWLEDLKSSNGTKLNEHPLQEPT